MESFDEFRFHTGSIKSVERIKEIQQQIQSFDSILVRLKVSELRIDTPTKLGFDSILVRLKVHYVGFYALRSVGFDSILVRLKVSRR